MAQEPHNENDEKQNRPWKVSGLGIGIALGVVLGTALDNLAIGIALGVALGAAFSIIKRD